MFEMPNMQNKSNFMSLKSRIFLYEVSKGIANTLSYKRDLRLDPRNSGFKTPLNNLLFILKITPILKSWPLKTKELEVLRVGYKSDAH